MTKQKAIDLANKKAKQNPQNEYLVYRDLDDYTDTWGYFVCTGNCLPYYTKDSEIIYSSCD